MRFVCFYGETPNPNDLFTLHSSLFTLAETLPQVAIPQEAVLGEKIFDGKLMTEAMARQLIADKRKTLTVMKGAILTPSAKDVLHYAGVEVLWKARG